MQSMVWKWLETVGRAVVEATSYFLPRNVGFITEATYAIANSDRALAEHREKMQLAQLQLEYLQHQDNLDFQAKQAKLSAKQAQELQLFIQRAEDTRLQKNLDFQRWSLEQEKALQLELLERNQTLQRELVTYQRQTSLKVVEEQKRLENSPIWLVASDILNSHPEDEVMPLRVFFAPPRLQFERFTNTPTAAKRFPDIELTLAEGLRQFFRNYSTSGRNIDFLAGAWVSKSFHSEASIKALFGVLKSEPTLVLESEVDGDYLNFRLAYWGLNWSKYRYEPIISRLPYRDILHESAKTRARRWLKTRVKLIAAGENPEDVDKLYGRDNVKNLETLQREERFRTAGVDSSELELSYSINKKDFDELSQFLIIYHCVFAGLVADEYFLVQYNLPPLLPQLLPNLTEGVPDTQVVQGLIQAIIGYYQNIYQALGRERSSWEPELAIDLARSLTHLPDKIWAKQEIIHSIKAWLNLCGLLPDNDVEVTANDVGTQGIAPLLQKMESALRLEDRDYVEKLNQCLAAVGEEKRLNITEACYQRGMRRCHEGDYSAAITDFDQAIELNPSLAKAFYNRGLAHAKLGQYQDAIASYTKVLETHENWADAYNNRGNAHYKLGNYEQAIADYNQALSINPDFPQAQRNRDIACGVLEEIKRKQQEEQERYQREEEQRKRQLENVSLSHSLTEHLNRVFSLAITPDGQTLVSGSGDNTIRIWQLSTGREIYTITKHLGYVYSLVISPDGQTLISGSADKTIKIWQLSTGQLIRTLTGHLGYVHSLAISPDGETLVSGSGDNTIKIWQLSTGQEIRTLMGHLGYIYALAISPDGEMLISGSADKTIKIWQLSTGQLIRTLTGHSGYVYSLAISPDGQTLVSGSADKTIKIWQLSTGQEIRTLNGHSGWVYSLAISPDGQKLVNGSADNSIKVWQLSTGEELRTIAEHSGFVYSLAISPDGQTLVSGSADSTVKIWGVR
jgi:WD40 repeat protein